MEFEDEVHKYLDVERTGKVNKSKITGNGKC